MGNSIERIRENYKSGIEYDLEFLSKERYSGMDEITEFVYESRENMILYYQALVNGFEIEEAPEDKVRDKFNRLDRYFNGDEQRQCDYGNGMHFVLEAFNIKISGVNVE